MTTTFAIPQVVRHKPTGNLLVTRSWHDASQHSAAHYRCSPIDNDCTSRGYATDDLEPAPPRKRGSPFDLKTEIVPRAQGVLPWEHVEPANLAWTLANVSCCGGWSAYPGIAWVQKPGQEPHADWARIFLHTTQGGGYTGQAHALVYEGRGARKPQHFVDAVVRAATQSVHRRRVPAGNIAAAVLAMEAARDEAALPSAWRLSICKHEVVDSSTPQGRVRGWHPAHCSKCGINLSVDSSD